MSDYYNNDTMELVIKPGDDISVIASAFGLTPEAIIAQNAGSWPPTPGQALQIPIPPQRCPSGTSYIIRQGDTLASIARRFSTTQAALLRENPFLVLLGPRPGLRICIPVVPSCPSSNLYTVRFGDTLPRIPQRFNTTVREILQANPGLDPRSFGTWATDLYSCPASSRLLWNSIYSNGWRYIVHHCPPVWHNSRCHPASQPGAGPPPAFCGPTDLHSGSTAPGLSRFHLYSSGRGHTKPDRLPF